MSQQDFYRVSFWGPRSSGKTWLFNAFLRKVGLLKKDLQQSGYSFKIVDQKNKREVSVEAPISGADDRQKGLGVHIMPTGDVVMKEYQFIRTKTGDNLIARVNTHSHDIYVIDDAGGKFQEKEQKLEDKLLYAREQAWETVVNSHFIILALNGERQVNLQRAENPSMSAPGSIVYQLRELAKMVAQKPDFGKHIAACLTKVDTLGEELIIDFYNKDQNENELRNLLIRSFGKRYTDEIYDILNEIRSGGKNQVKLFATSAAGYYTLEGKKTANLHPDGDGVADTTQWQPEEVERPFFWLFEAMERQRLAYIPSEWNLFQFIMGKNTILKTRIELYKSYAQLIQVAKSNRP